MFVRIVCKLRKFNEWLGGASLWVKCMGVGNGLWSGFPLGFWMGRDAMKVRCHCGLKNQIYQPATDWPYDAAQICVLWGRYTKDFWAWFEMDLRVQRSSKQTDTCHIQEDLWEFGCFKSLVFPLYPQIQSSGDIVRRPPSDLRLQSQPIPPGPCRCYVFLKSQHTLTPYPNS